MAYRVLLTDSALRDLEEIHIYLAQNDTTAAAERVLDQIAKVIEDLENFPERGAHPSELLALGTKEYRAMFFKPYKVIYRVGGDTVHIHLIADGRRDMQSLLAKRLLES
jgi:toxin ParE1/3/4